MVNDQYYVPLDESTNLVEEGMSRFKRLQPEALETNPFVDKLAVYVVSREKKVEEEDGVIVSEKLYFEYTPYSKIFTSTQFREVTNKLEDKAVALLLWIIYEIKAGEDFICINRERYMKEKSIKSKTTITNAIANLVDNGLLCNTRHTSIYWINPRFFFKGNRPKKFVKNIKVINETKIRSK